MIVYASEFSEIPQALRSNPAIKERMLALISGNKVSGKVTEGGDRLMKLRLTLSRLTNDQLSLDEAIREVEHQLPRHTSIHSDSNQVFSSNWAERLIRTQYSRFYNQAVLEDQIAKGKSECYVPPSSQEDAVSQCSQTLAGRSHDISYLLKLLVTSYEEGKWDKTPKIPDHPHCTHVVKPIS
ncbi:hypothetical protein FJP64_12345 [Kosakonia cowanii]|jgi:hypothetical protein|uniref:hypothetical protein n=1 Tax=Enterobacterales TaxID=91347 RepID=UPI00111F7C43|nr:hypothetical protein [Kosakonia cowanii]TPD65051.1 hypothetical protein FJP70_12325 [Kosakonia cowanii]TPD89237.1 hypothetical protein FJP67_12335 [Kosakonia cowanii]TPE05679.1 hypothetical protein FJP64_12345 [Kosakonia cowanii]